MEKPHYSGWTAVHSRVHMQRGAALHVLHGEPCKVCLTNSTNALIACKALRSLSTQDNPDALMETSSCERS